ncbi:MAG TPA: Holliday junction branch migration protein RuvA [Clostridiales bacterium UBA8153]|nr:Holliday junction branch migration protein RuvA [Clostridiales bacterium UBA8153]
MIAYLRGTVRLSSPGQVILEVSGVGYRLLVPASTEGRLPGKGEATALHTHLHVREDALSLYGFSTPAELELFQLLLGVSGIGPRTALGVVGATSPDTFYQALLNQDTAYFSRLPGIGKRTAQKLVLELREKVGGPPPELPPGDTAVLGELGQLMEALMALGYTRAESAASASQVVKESPAGSSIEELIRRALRGMARV